MLARVALLTLAIATGCGGAAKVGVKRAASSGQAAAHHSFDFASASGASEIANASPRDKHKTSKSALELFTEPDALVFVWGSATVATSAFLATEPGTSSFLFGSGGGAEQRGNTIPNWEVAAGAAVAPVLIAATGGDGRWYHTKGLVESLLTTAALTELAKNGFSRQRPVYDEGSTNPDDRKSFFSGHSSLTLAATTYAGLYLHGHVFSRWRGAARIAWWELPPFFALAAASVWIPKTRLDDHMHHPSDLIVGAAVGASFSTAFYLWQERRYRRDRRETDNVVVMPLVATPGAAVRVAFD